MSSLEHPWDFCGPVFRALSVFGSELSRKITVRQGFFHPCSNPASTKWRTKGDLLSRGVCNQTRAFLLPPYSALGLQPHFHLHHLRVFLLSLLLIVFGQQGSSPSPIFRILAPFWSSLSCSMHNWSTAGFSGWLKSLVQDHRGLTVELVGGCL